MTLYRLQGAVCPDKRYREDVGTVGEYFYTQDAARNIKRYIEKCLDISAVNITTIEVNDMELAKG